MAFPDDANNKFVSPESDYEAGPSNKVYIKLRLTNSREKLPSNSHCQAINNE